MEIFSGYLASMVTIFISIFGIFEWAEKVLRREHAERFISYLRDVHTELWLRKLPNEFISIFDALFSKRHISLKCFLNSSLVSISVVLVLTIVWSFTHPQQFLIFLDSDEYLWFFPTIIILNVIPDYFSLLETRYLLHWMSKTRSWYGYIIVMIIDIIATLLIAFVIGGILMGIVNQSLTGHYDIFQWFLYYPIYLAETFFSFGISFEARQGVSMGVFIYSTLWTSVWLWLFILATTVMRFIQPAHRIGALAFHLINFETAPYRGIGAVAAVIACIIYLVSQIAYAIFH